MLDWLNRSAIAKTVWIVGFLALAAVGIMITPQNKPPGTAFQIQLHPGYRPAGGRLIRDKSRIQSQLIQDRGTASARGFSYAPRRIELRCDSPINAFLVDLTDVPRSERAALQTHPDARKPGGVEVKPLKEYPILGDASGSTRIEWKVARWRLKHTLYKLVVECPSNPHAVIDVKIDYGGNEWDHVHY